MTETIAKTGNTALERPDFVQPGDKRGTEHLTQEDKKYPRLKLAQNTSDQIKKDSDKFIDGLVEGQLFNDLDGTIIGTGPIEFVVLRADPPKYMEFDPDTRAVIRFDVPATIPGPNGKMIVNPDTQFGVDSKGKSVKPLATKIYDYVLLLLPTMEMTTFSLSSSGLEAARVLNALIDNLGASVFSGKYVMTTAKKKGKRGEYYRHVITRSNIESDFSALRKDGTKMPNWINQELSTKCAEWFEMLKGVELDGRKDIEPDADADAEADTFDERLEENQ